MVEGDSHLVSARDLESLLAELKPSVPNPSRSIFAPDSISWKINRESALFLAAGRAALLQLAHPWVATAIAEHSRTLNDPIARFHHTFRVMFTVVFGSLDQALAASRHLHRRHKTIRGTLPAATARFPQGTAYEANEVSALCWVYATLIDSALLAYELVLPPLRDAERERYYAESCLSAALFGIPREYLPSDWAGFCLYMNSALQSDMLGVSAATREMAQRLQNGAGLRVRPPFWYRALTTDLLPPRLREELHFDYGERERISAARAVRWLRPIYPRLPASLRFVGPYNEVQARLRGCAQPRWTIRQSNQLWIGQPSLLTAPEQS
ncbi:MAG: oxygenase MpaB family protein [Candidatus Korobacteraceae bacterium]